MITSLIAAALAVAPIPSDDIDIIGVELVELVIATPDAVPLCDAYGGIIAAIDGMGVDYSAADTLLQAADALIIVNVEGDSMRLDNEARDRIVEWLHTDCM